LGEGRGSGPRAWGPIPRARGLVPTRGGRVPASAGAWMPSAARTAGPCGVAGIRESPDDEVAADQNLFLGKPDIRRVVGFSAPVGQIEAEPPDGEADFIVVDLVRTPMPSGEDIVGPAELASHDEAVEVLRPVIALEAFQHVPVRNDSGASRAVCVRLLVQQPLRLLPAPALPARSLPRHRLKCRRADRRCRMETALKGSEVTDQPAGRLPGTTRKGRGVRRPLGGLRLNRRP
jgi:hypothetical protein